MNKADILQILQHYVFDNVGIEESDFSLLADDILSLQRWIPVSERLPENGKSVVVHIADRNMELFASYDGEWDCEYYKPTHWMSLPNKPPKEEK